MKRSEIIRRFKDAQKYFYSGISTTIDTTGKQTFELTDPISLKETIHLIEDIEIFREEIETIKNLDLPYSTKDRIPITKDVANKLGTAIGTIKIKLEQKIETIGLIFPDDDPDSLNIKLPPINDFEDLSKVSKDLHFAIGSLVIDNKIGGKLEIQSVDNGSIWITITLGSIAAINLVGVITWAALSLVNKIQSIQVTQEKINSLRLDNSHKDAVNNALKNELNTYVEVEARHINSDNFKTDDPENLNRIMNSIKVLSELISKGAEVHPSIEMSKDQRVNFPDFKNKSLIESRIQRLINNVDQQNNE